ncbi:MAG: PQQ-binding-like beta-propeller repeat protein [Planctomycetia bacterium]|nr:PQQ-binding-like beta-propeller repeat protein [Planctomycetia bacterium]
MHSSLWTEAGTLLQSFVVLIASVLPTAPGVPGAHWPRWRGPLEDGHSQETDIPTKWSNADVVWKTPLPGSGQSSPIVWGDRIFLTSALEDGKQRVVYAVDRKTGKILWQHTAWTGEPEKLHAWNSWASSTCATDGEVVVAFFGRGGLHGYGVDGKHLWSRDLGKFESPWGVAACPVILGDLVIQNCDAEADASLSAFDKRTGKTVWTTKRPNNRGWSTPILVQAEKRRELVLNGHDGVRGYDPATGKELWFCKSFNGRGEPTVTAAGDLLYVSNGLAGDFYAIKPGGDGDVTKTHMAWHVPRKGGRDIPSPIVVGKFIVMVDTGGIATCYDAADGHEYWKERLATGPKFTASPIAVGGLVYFLNEAGTTIVVEPAATLKIVQENILTGGEDEIFRATLAPCEGRLFVRSTNMLYCIGKK